MANKVAIFSCLFCFFSVSFSTAGDFEHFRLPTSVTPTNYLIKLKPNIDEGTFEGNVTIYLDVKTKVGSIVLHSTNLNYTYVSLDLKSPEEVEYKFETKYETIEIFYKEKGKLIDPGVHLLYFEYKGSLLNEDYGFRRVRYEGVNNKTGYVLVSDFESTYARRAFPCFDEPQIKAYFSTRIIAPNTTYVALSNMKAINVIPTANGIIYDFQKSPLMSTYLNSFVLTDYPFVETYWCNKKGQNVPIRIYSPFALGEGNSFTLGVVKRTLDYLTLYTGLEYPLPKLDFIEFESAEEATENWGMIIGKTGIFTVASGLYDKNQIGLLTVHELTHSWFGNLVTNLWWDDLWIHEGLTTFMSYKIYSYFYLNSTESQNQVIDEIQNIQNLDVTEESSPVAVFAVSSNDTDSRFSDFTYSKGFSVLQTTEQILGPWVFMWAVRTFLEKYKYKSASTNDFINVLEELKPEINIRNYIFTWFYQTGFPIIYVKENGVNGSFITLTQDEFPGKFDTKTTNKRKRWTIPVWYITDKKCKKFVWFDQDANEITIPINENNKWIKFNPGQTTMYRVNYTEKMWENLINNMKDFENVDQAGLIFESASLVSSGVTHCKIYLQVLRKIIHENRNNAQVIKSATTYTTYQVFSAFFANDSAAFDKAIDYAIPKLKSVVDKHEVFMEQAQNNFVNGLNYEIINNCRDWIKNYPTGNEV